MERSPGRGSEGYHSTCTCRRSHSRSSSSLRSSSSSSLRLSLCLCSKARELLMAMAASATDPEHNKQNGRRHGPSSSQLKAAPAAAPTQPPAPRPGPRSHKQLRLSRPPLWPSICSLRLRPAREKSRTPLVRGMLCLCLQPRLHSMPQLATQAEIRSAASVCFATESLAAATCGVQHPPRQQRRVFPLLFSRTQKFCAAFARCTRGVRRRLMLSGLGCGQFSRDSNTALVTSSSHLVVW